VFIPVTALVIVFNCSLADSRAGAATLQIEGKNAKKLFAKEAGGHRWQRIPPTEKRGRKQTSTVTVAIMEEPPANKIRLSENDLEWKTCRGSGAGGQHRNKTDSAVQLTHIPTGTRVRVESERSQSRNKETARHLLRAKLDQAAEEHLEAKLSNKRRKQVGSGMRGDKIRTIRTQDGQVTDHRTNKKINLRKFMKGELEGLL
jgi:peptide chain release factor 1